MKNERFHETDTGEWRKCEAKSPEKCPFKGNPHASSMEELAQIAEKEEMKKIQLLNGDKGDSNYEEKFELVSQRSVQLLGILREIKDIEDEDYKDNIEDLPLYKVQQAVMEMSELDDTYYDENNRPCGVARLVDEFNELKDETAKLLIKYKIEYDYYNFEDESKGKDDEEIYNEFRAMLSPENYDFVLRDLSTTITDLEIDDYEKTHGDPHQMDEYDLYFDDY